jgi:hypothetical protein
MTDVLNYREPVRSANRCNAGEGARFERRELREEKGVARSFKNVSALSQAVLPNLHSPKTFRLSGPHKQKLVLGSSRHRPVFGFLHLKCKMPELSRDHRSDRFGEQFTFVPNTLNQPFGFQMVQPRKVTLE